MREKILALIDGGATMGAICRETGLSPDGVMELLNGPQEDEVRPLKKWDSEERACMRLCTAIHHAQPPENLPAGHVRTRCKAPCPWSRGRDACVMPGGCWKEIFKK